jgi:hypothetical protein
MLHPVVARFTPNPLTPRNKTAVPRTQILEGVANLYNEMTAPGDYWIVVTVGSLDATPRLVTRLPAAHATDVRVEAERKAASSRTIRRPVACTTPLKIRVLGPWARSPAIE